MKLLVLLALLVLSTAHAEKDTCSGGECSGDDSPAAEKYSRQKNQPDIDVRARVASLQGALMNLMKDPYNTDVLRSSLVELAEFADTPEGVKFMESFTKMMAGGSASGPAGAVVKQLFSAVMAGNVDLGSLMKNGVNAASLASLASGLLKKEGSASNVKPDDIMPLLKNFLSVIKEEQASPFLLEKLNKAFEESLSLEQLKKFEKSAATVLGSIRGATEEDDSDFVYDQAALDTFTTFLRDFAEMHEWNWSQRRDTLVREIKRVMRMFPGAEDQIGTLLPAVMEAIVEAQPSKTHLNEIIENFGGVLGIVVKKNKADPEVLRLVIDKLKTPLKQSAQGAKDTDSTHDSDTKKSSEEGLPDISRLVDSVGKLINNPSEIQEAVTKAMAKGKDLSLQDLGTLLPKVDGLDEMTAYFQRVQDSGDEREIANHFHKLMDMVGESFDILGDKQVRLAALQQALPYVRTVHEFLKDPMALFKIQMGFASLSSMYQINVDEMIKNAAPHVEDTLSVIGISLDLPSFVADARQFLLRAYHQVYQSPDSAFKKLSGAREDTYIVEAIDHAVTEPIVLVLGAYRLVREHPDCLLQTLCTVSREAKNSDRGQLGVRPGITKAFSRVFGLLLATSQYGIDSPIHEQIAEALQEASTSGQCQQRYPGCSLVQE